MERFLIDEFARVTIEHVVRAITANRAQIPMPIRSVRLCQAEGSLVIQNVLLNEGGKAAVRLPVEPVVIPPAHKRSKDAHGEPEEECRNIPRSLILFELLTEAESALRQLGMQDIAVDKGCRVFAGEGDGSAKPSLEQLVEQDVEQKLVDPATAEVLAESWYASPERRSWLVGRVRAACAKRLGSGQRDDLAHLKGNAQAGLDLTEGLLNRYGRLLKEGDLRRIREDMEVLRQSLGTNDEKQLNDALKKLESAPECIAAVMGSRVG